MSTRRAVFFSQESEQLLGHGQPFRDHISKENAFSCPWEPLCANTL